MMSQMPRPFIVACLMLVAGCAYVAPPTSPAVVTPPPVVYAPEPPPPVSRQPLAIGLNVGGRMRGQPSYFRAMTLADSIADPAVYIWTFGDGARAETTENATVHVYRSAGFVEPMVSVTDHEGRTVQASTVIEVVSHPALPPDRPGPTQPPPPPPPPAAMTASMSCTGHATLDRASCNMTGTYNGSTVPSARVTSVDWDWGDGTTSTSTGPAQSHTYSQPGTYTVIGVMTATTADGPKTATASRAVTVPAPTTP
jgi:PKD repeat protein